MALPAAKWRFRNIPRPGIQSPGYVEKAPPEGGSLTENAAAPGGNPTVWCVPTVARAPGRLDAHQNRTGFSRFSSDVAGDFSPRRKGTSAQADAGEVQQQNLFCCGKTHIARDTRTPPHPKSLCAVSLWCVARFSFHWEKMRR